MLHLWHSRNFKSAKIPGHPCGSVVLGTPKRQHFLYLIDTINARLTSWKAKTLSFAGCLILIKHVLSSIPIHTTAVVPIPISICNDIERLMRNFLWSGSGQSTKINYVNWNLVCLPKSEGGLGIRKTSEVNDACLLKLGWQASTATTLVFMV